MSMPKLLRDIGRKYENGNTKRHRKHAAESDRKMLGSVGKFLKKSTEGTTSNDQPSEKWYM